MPRLAQTTIDGASGKSYAFNVYERDSVFNDFIPVVYYISRRLVNADGDLDETPIFVGESDNVRIALEKHDKTASFEEQGYNAISFYRNASAQARKAVQQDLIDSLKPSLNE